MNYAVYTEGIRQYFLYFSYYGTTIMEGPMEDISNRKTIHTYNYEFANARKQNATKHYLFTNYQIFTINYINDFSIDAEQYSIDVEQ